VGVYFATEGGAWVTHYEPDSDVWLRMGRIAGVNMPKRKSKSPPTWTDVKAKLVDFDRTALLALIESLYTSHRIRRFFMPALA
jgi:hypothetical protein